jgi:serine/threonine-protein kinase HipA
MNRCAGCLKESRSDFCGKCRRELFDGAKVPRVLPFARPAYDEARRAVSPGRLSISGVQTKMSLKLNAGALELVQSGGQYILKPKPHGDFERPDAAPINEHLTMQIARQVFGVSVAHNALVEFRDGERAYLVRRFDVQPDGTRALQEDFAQLAARSVETHGANYKYELTYEEIGELIRAHVAAHAVDSERFFALVAFNYLVHNGDAHAKNFSLIRNEQTGQYNLTPAYDLLNTRLHLPGETRTALELFKDDFRTESFESNAFYAHDDFVEFARRLGLVDVRYKRILQALVEKENEVRALVARSELSDECKELYAAHVTDRARTFAPTFFKWKKK